MTNSTAYAIGGNDVIAAGKSNSVIVKGTFDIANVAATVTTGGYAEILQVPANTFFEILAAEIVTVTDLDASTSDRVDIGDADDDDLYVSNATTNTAGYDYVLTGATTLDSTHRTSKLYTDAGSIRLKLTGDKLAGGTANASGKIRFVFRLTDTNDVALATAKTYTN